jgi:beta-phosphoglucomutase family hydrolase
VSASKPPGELGDPGELGLPAGIWALLFDLDGVLTKTAVVHAAAWKQMFDEFLQGYAARHGQEFRPFDATHDYDSYVDGKPRVEGTRSFLASRGIVLPEGSAVDPPGAETVHGLGNRKNELVLELIRQGGVEPYEGSVAYVEAARRLGLRCAVVSSSTNCKDVLKAAGIDLLFDTIVDGIVAEREGLRGKPQPDTFLFGAKSLGAVPKDAAVFEDSLAGVEAGRAGQFGFVVGVDRVGQAAALAAHGADVVVKDLSELPQARAHSRPQAQQPAPQRPQRQGQQQAQAQQARAQQAQAHHAQAQQAQPPA